MSDGYQENKPKITNIIKGHYSTRHALILYLMVTQMPRYLNTYFLLRIKRRENIDLQAAKLETGPGDANTEIVQVPSDLVGNEMAVIVKVEDAYILQLLLYFWNSDLSNMAMRSELRKYNQVTMNAWGDYDTISAIFGQEQDFGFP